VSHTRYASCRLRAVNPELLLSVLEMLRKEYGGEVVVDEKYGPMLRWSRHGYFTVSESGGKVSFVYDSWAMPGSFDTVRDRFYHYYNVAAISRAMRKIGYSVNLRSTGSRTEIVGVRL